MPSVLELQWTLDNRLHFFFFFPAPYNYKHFSTPAGYVNEIKPARMTAGGSGGRLWRAARFTENQLTSSGLKNLQTTILFVWLHVFQQLIIAPSTSLVIVIFGFCILSLRLRIPYWSLGHTVCLGPGKWSFFFAVSLWDLCWTARKEEHVCAQGGKETDSPGSRQKHYNSENNPQPLPNCVFEPDGSRSCCKNLHVQDLEWILFDLRVKNVNLFHWTCHCFLICTTHSQFLLHEATNTFRVSFLTLLMELFAHRWLDGRGTAACQSDRHCLPNPSKGRKWMCVGQWGWRGQSHMCNVMCVGLQCVY